VEYLKKIGLLDSEAHGPILVIQLRKLLNISNLAQIPKVSQVGAYRLAKTAIVDPYVLFTWLRMCDLIVENQYVEQELNVNRLNNVIPLIKDLMFVKDIADVQSRLKAYLAECGIRFAIVKYFRGASVQGVIKKNDDGTLNLIMTTRRSLQIYFGLPFFMK